MVVPPSCPHFITRSHHPNRVPSYTGLGGDENVTHRSAPLKLTPVFFSFPRKITTKQIEYYGGYENVARRLHLGYHYEDERQYQEKVRDELKVQNEKYGRVRELNIEQQRNKLAKLKVRLHMKRVNQEREMKLADGLRRRRTPEGIERSSQQAGQPR